MKRIIFLVGPTAIGKTEVAIKLADKIGAQIISCDSMQVYRQMNIISDKPSKSQQKKVKHYLIDAVSIERKFSAAVYLKKAKEAIKKIHKRGKVVLIVGGSGLYMQTLLDGIFTQAKADLSMRKSLYKQAKDLGREYLYKRLKRIDPKAASKIHVNDLRKIIRALEVFQITGIPISKLQKKRRGGIWNKFDIKIFGLAFSRDELYHRVNKRVDRMFRQGLVNEVKKLATKRLSQTASGSIGISEIRQYLEGNCSLNEARDKMKQATRNFAKRQLTWFRKEKRISWIKISKDDSAADIAKRLLSLI